MILYIHGFNTGAGGTKANQLSAHFKDHEFCRLDLSYQPDLAIQQLKTFVEQAKAKHILLIGSSLGGFYARYLASRFDLDIALINPSINPAKSLQRALGTWTNYVTGEEYEWTPNCIEQLKKYYVKNESIRGQVLLFVDRGDELLDPQEAIDCYQGFADMHIFDNGSHKFEHLNEALPLIRNFYESKLT